jgi:hypothetical protein
MDDALNKIYKQYSNIPITITGDFNRLPLEDFIDRHGLTDIAQFSTRGDARLDRILTTTNYMNAVKHAPLAQNDHCSITVDRCGAKPVQYVSVSKRKVTTSVKNAILLELARQSWDAVVFEADLNVKVDIFYQIINDILDKHATILDQ